MTHTPLQIEIIKKFGRKELTEGCIVGSKKFHIYESDIVFSWVNRCSWNHKNGERTLLNFRVQNPLTEDDEHFNARYDSIEILGHLPTLEDLHRMMNERFPHGWEQISKIRYQSDSPYNQDRIIIKLLSSSTVKMDGSHMAYIRYDSNLPLIEQDESTLSQLLSLFK